MSSPFPFVYHFDSKTDAFHVPFIANTKVPLAHTYLRKSKPWNEVNIYGLLTEREAKFSSLTNVTRARFQPGFIVGSYLALRIFFGFPSFPPSGLKY